MLRQRNWPGACRLHTDLVGLPNVFVNEHRKSALEAINTILLKCTIITIPAAFLPAMTKMELQCSIGRILIKSRKLLCRTARNVLPALNMPRQTISPDFIFGGVSTDNWFFPNPFRWEMGPISTIKTKDDWLEIIQGVNKKDGKYCYSMRCYCRWVERQLKNTLRLMWWIIGSAEGKLSELLYELKK